MWNCRKVGVVRGCWGAAPQLLGSEALDGYQNGDSNIWDRKETKDFQRVKGGMRETSLPVGYILVSFAILSSV